MQSFLDFITHIHIIQYFFISYTKCYRKVVFFWLYSLFSLTPWYQSRVYKRKILLRLHTLILKQRSEEISTYVSVLIWTLHRRLNAKTFYINAKYKIDDHSNSPNLSQNMVVLSRCSESSRKVRNFQYVP